MSQSRRMSAAETVTSTAVGFGVSYVASLLLLPALGYPVTHAENTLIVCVFTVLSLLRGYCLRRIFNAVSGVK